MHRNKMVRYSMTSSARASSVGGTVKLSALAVFRLMTRATLVGIWIGRSAGDETPPVAWPPRAGSSFVLIGFRQRQWRDGPYSRRRLLAKAGTPRRRRRVKD